MRHPSDGILRRLLDEPAGVADADRQHVAGCPACLSGLAAAQQDAASTAEVLEAGWRPAQDVETAWARLKPAVAGHERPAAASGAPGRRWRSALSSPVVAALGVVALLAGGGAAVAVDWLQVFRAEQVAPVTLSEADLLELPDLSAYGEVEVVEEVDVRQVPGADAAADATGLPVPRVDDLPRGVAGDPVFRVGDQASVVFTFSAEQAAEAAAQTGETLPPPPVGLDGNQFRLDAGPGLVAVWPSTQGVPALAVARAVAPTAYSSSVPFAVARDYLLSMPGLPESVATQLRSVSGDGATLPVPLAAEEMDSSTAEVNGIPATVLTSTDGVMAAVVWADDGLVTVVVGSMSAEEVLGVARDLRWDG